MKTLQLAVLSIVLAGNCQLRAEVQREHLDALLDCSGKIHSRADRNPDTDRMRGLVVHEWGTFTSVQGGDGVLLSWHPPQTPELPGFVYDWKKPGLNRKCISSLGLLGKGAMVTLQRMETPVIYFYSDIERRVDVSVQFPKGLVTEWYPQAARIGPAVTAGETPVKESLIEWKNVRVLPAKENQALANQLPIQKTGNHYFAARETDSVFLQVDSRSTTNSTDEREKFLFYRGVGNFATPLKVTTSADGKVTVENTGKEPLAHLFLLSAHDGNGAWSYLDKLGPGHNKEWAQIGSGELGYFSAKEKFQDQIGAKMQTALAGEGLFPREAEAMVKTWRESWFAEDGVRVLYILPRAWTDEALPMKLNPQPRELTRVMVGRAEIITPEMQRNLSTQLASAKAGDAAAKETVQTMLKSFGRFARPALQLATRNKPEINQFGYTLLQTAFQSAPAKQL